MLVRELVQDLVQPLERDPWGKGGASFPASLALLWSSTKYAKSLKGPQPVYTDTPTVTADGVTPGDGPAFTSVVVWTEGGTRMIRFTASSASSSLSGDVEIGGGFYAYSGGLKFKDGVNTATCATSWLADEVVTGVVSIDAFGALSISRTEGFANLVTSPNDITAASWSTQGSAVRTSADILTMAAASNSRLISAAAQDIPVTTGQRLRLSAIVEDLQTANHYLQVGMIETFGSFTVSSITMQSWPGNGGLICVEHVASGNGNVRLLFGNNSSSPGTVKLRDIRVSKKVSGSRSDGLVAFGDSICAASQDTGGVNEGLLSYTAVFARLKSVPYINRGVNGETLTQINSRISSQIGTPGTVFLEGGANDIFGASSDPNAAMRSAMSSMIATAKASCGNVVCFDIPPIPIDATKEAWRVAYNAWLEAECETQSVGFVSLDALMRTALGEKNLDYYTANETHPNIAGHAVIADYLVKNVKYIGDNLEAGEVVNFDTSMPPFSLSSTAPGALLEVQEWTRSDVTKKQIDKVSP